MSSLNESLQAIKSMTDEHAFKNKKKEESMLEFGRCVKILVDIYKTKMDEETASFVLDILLKYHKKLEELQ